MITFTEIVLGGESLSPQYKIELPYDLRKKSRLRTQATCGEELGLVLPRGHILRDGTFVKNAEGNIAQVIAANETVSTVSTEDPIVLAKAAYHLGNRHVPLQVGEGWLRYQHDHVLDEMVKGLGLTVCVEQAEFEPEDGAYANGGHHHHH